MKPEFWSDYRLERLGFATRLIYIGLWNEADDAGWLRWDPQQLYTDLLRSEVDRPEGLRLLRNARASLVRRKRLIVYRCGHAQIPNLPKNQHLGGTTRRVETTLREHAQCPADTRGSARSPADTRDSPPVPVSIGPVRSGQLSNGSPSREEQVQIAKESIAKHKSGEQPLHAASLHAFEILIERYG